MRSLARPLALAISLTMPLAVLAWQTPPKQAPAKPSAPKPAAKLAWPAAVEAAFKQAYPNATVKNVAKEKQKGLDVYEVESMDAGRRRDLMYKPDGTVISFEEEVAAADLPAAVSGAIKTRYPKATLGLCEKLMEGTTMRYEIQIKGVPKVSSVELTPGGQWVSPKAAK
jgi:hypothetical protein